MDRKPGEEPGAGRPWIPLLSIIVVCSALLISLDRPRSEASPSGISRSGKAPCRTGNRLYRRQNGLPGYWRAADIDRISTEHIPWTAVPAAGGLYADDGNFYVRMRTDNGVRAVQTLVDENSYRIRMPDGSAGPRLVMQSDGTWNYLSLRDDYVPGTVLANVVPEVITTHALTLQHAARIMEVLGVSELTLANFLLREGAGPASPFTYMAVGHAMIDNLPARLRDRDATEWSPHEAMLLTPAMAMLVGRPIVIHDGHGKRFSFLADGTQVNDTVPAGAAVEVHWENGRYRLGSRYAPTDYSSIFAAVEAATRPPTSMALLPAEREALFRGRLAEALEARSTRPELETIFRQWIDKQPMPEPERQRLKSVARLRHALFDRHHALTAAEEQRLLEATWSLMPMQRHIAIEVRQRDSHALLTRIDSHTSVQERIVIAADLDADGHRVAYYRVDPQGEAIRSRPVNRSFSEIIDAILNGGDRKVSRLLGVGSWDWQVFADKLLARIADDENALLPLPWEPLVIRDEGTLRDAATQMSDRWAVNGRHYARLRNLDGRTQVVEIDPVAEEHGHRILPPTGVTGPGSNYYIGWRDDKWYPHHSRAWHATHAAANPGAPSQTLQNP